MTITSKTYVRNDTNYNWKLFRESNNAAEDLAMDLYRKYLVGSNGISKVKREYLYTHEQVTVWFGLHFKTVYTIER